MSAVATAPVVGIPTSAACDRSIVYVDAPVNAMSAVATAPVVGIPAFAAFNRTVVRPDAAADARAAVAAPAGTDRDDCAIDKHVCSLHLLIREAVPSSRNRTS
jgi:hypothetical protein